MPRSLLAAAGANPKQVFQVIVQGGSDRRSAQLADRLERISDGSGPALDPAAIQRQFSSIDGLAVSIPGQTLVALARRPDVVAITPNAPVRLAATAPAPTSSALMNSQMWAYASGAQAGWHAKGAPPAIAVVDSGIDASRADFGGRVVTQVNLSTLPGNSPGDGRGHGTFVASIAAGSAPGHTGISPTAPLVSLDVMDDSGMARISDVIAACDWIAQNKGAYGIRVANFSLHAARPASILFDPLDKAVEKLWLGGVVVVAAAGNYGVDGKPSGVLYAPGNDPFVITVGATDIGNTVADGDDVNAPWSAYGYTYDGFAKPDVAAPGRYMIGAVPTTATLTTERPGSVVSPGYMQLSGTSFAAPVVAGAAAEILARHPDWTPDQVKGAIMITATAAKSAAPLSVGVGEVDVADALKRDVVPPNPNAALDRFVTPDPLGGPVPVFDASAWQSAASASSAWGTAAWSDAAWSSAAWSSAAWSSVAWSSSAWSTSAWGTAAWSDAAWSDAAWSDSAWADNGEGDPTPGETATGISPEEAAAALEAMGLAPEDDPIAALAASTDTAATTDVTSSTDPLTAPLP